MIWDLAVGPLLGGVLGLLAARLPAWAARPGLALAFGVGGWLVMQPPWPPVSAAQRLFLVAPLALVAGLGGRRMGGAGAATAALLAVGWLLARVFSRAPGEGLLLGVVLLGATGAAGALAAPGRGGRLVVGAAGLVSAGTIAATGSIYLGAYAAVIGLAVLGLATGRAVDAGVARAGTMLLAVVLALAVRLSALPWWAALLVGLSMVAGHLAVATGRQRAERR